ncbi:MAG TPA: SDR family NAD(P)-dependent oxidoreductase [Rhizomicrobium sp.]|nr:SDR family NAD(P)-dependent oxidoreductase [Rhizomicrobium sp.]
MKDFRGKTAFVTGGGSGIGYGMARAFGRAGMNVVIADIEDKVAHKAAEMLQRDQIKAVPVHCDVALRGELQRAALEAVAAFGKIHIVCNNAGVGGGGEFGTVGERDWDWIIDVNLKGVIYGAETFVPLIKSHGEGGHIINTASMAGLVSPPRMEPYSATKYAVVAMSEGWQLQLAPFGIGVSVLCPGFVRTRIHESSRTRQERYGVHREASTGDNERRAETAKAIESGLDPLIVGERVLEAVKAGELYIFTHPEMREFVETRFKAIDDAFGRAAHSEVLKAARK